MNIIKGRTNLAATIFVPWDCSNNCKFCTSKALYKSKKGNMAKVKTAILQINKLDINEVVFTGGEPFASISALEQLLNLVAEDKKVYINTTLPLVDESLSEEMVEFINTNKKISGINISRHFSSYNMDCYLFSGNIMKDEWIGKINKPVRINCIVLDELNVEDVLNRWKPYSNVTIVFRADYRKITKATLKDLTDPFIDALSSKASYQSHGGCDVCFDVCFDNDGQSIHYHKGLEYSSFMLGDNLFVNDVIIRQNGEISYDWDDSHIYMKELFDQLKKKPSKTVNGRTYTKTASYRSLGTCGSGAISIC